jgi:very-short-patch-repair endonuclease
MHRSNFHLPYNPALVARAKEMRSQMPPAERRLWKGYLRHFPYRVLRQRPIDQFIVDFYCAALRLVIEVDGESHDFEEAKERDLERTRVLEGYGLRVVRFTNQEVMEDFEGVCGCLQSLLPLTP